MKKIEGLIIMMLIAGFVQAQQRYELTVKEAVDLAYKNIVDVKNAEIDLKMQEAKNKEILGQALPQVSGSVSTNRYLAVPKFLFPQSDEGIYKVLTREGLLPSGTTAPPPTFAPVSFQQPWNFAMGATLTQLLFQPDVFVGLQARQTSIDYYNALLEQTKEKIKDSAYKRYYAILIAQKQLFFINESLVRLNKLYHDDSIMYRNGFAEQLDLDKVQVQINNLKTTQSLMTSAVVYAYAGLKFAIGISQRDSIVLKDELTIASLKDNILDESFKYEDRAEIRTLSQTQKLLGLDVKRYKLGYIPTVSLSGNYSVNGMGPKFFTDNSTIWFRSSFVGLNINIPIFDGLQRKYKIQQSQLTLEKMNNTITNVKQGIDLQQVIAKETLKTSLSNLDIQDRNLALAQKVYNATKLKFEQGLGSSFEVLQADADYQTAQSNYFSALYNATVAKISYQSALGKLQ
jgi:outer membrane protein